MADPKPVDVEAMLRFCDRVDRRSLRSMSVTLAEGEGVATSDELRRMCTELLALRAEVAAQRLEHVGEDEAKEMAAATIARAKADDAELAALRRLRDAVKQLRRVTQLLTVPHKHHEAFCNGVHSESGDCQGVYYMNREEDAVDEALRACEAEAKGGAS